MSGPTPAALMPDPDGYLVAFEDGPMSDKGNVPTLSGASAGRFVIPREMFGWPLPDRISAALVGWSELTLQPIAHPFEGTPSDVVAAAGRAVAIWNTEEPGGANLPEKVISSEHVVVYAKESESQLPDDSNSHVMRGAAYRLETK